MPASTLLLFEADECFELASPTEECTDGNPVVSGDVRITPESNVRVTPEGNRRVVG